MATAPNAEAISAALDVERETTSRFINPIRLAVVGLFWSLLAVLGWGVGEVEWRAGFGLFSAYLVLATVLYFAGRRFKKAARRFAWGLALVDVPIVYLLQRSTFDSSTSPGAVAGFTIGIFALMVALAALSIDVQQIAAVAVSASVFGVVLQSQAGISVGGRVAAVVVLAFTALGGFVLYRRLLALTGRLLEDLTFRRKLQAELEHSERMATLGLLSASIAHEVGSPLQVLRGNLELLEMRINTGKADAEKVTSDLHAAIGGADRITAILQDIRGMARKDSSAIPETNVHKVIETVTKLARAEVGKRANLMLELHDVPTVRMNESRLSQVLLNLLLNAGQAIPEGQRNSNSITVRTRAAATGEVLISVSDTGAGIAPDLVEKLFTPFFTTKPAGEGTGLGLTISAQLVRDVGGRIEVESTPGRGSTFTVRLPPASAPPPDPAKGPSSWRQNQR